MTGTTRTTRSTAVLEEVHLTAFKSFQNATLPILPLTVLTGRNNSGKSNALDGIEVLSRRKHSGLLRGVMGSWMGVTVCHVDHLGGVWCDHRVPDLEGMTREELMAVARALVAKNAVLVAENAALGEGVGVVEAENATLVAESA